MRDALRCSVAAVFVALAACKPDPAPTAGAEPGPAHGATQGPDAAATGAPSADPASAGCTVDADCDGGICEGEGCGPNEGVCQPADRMCTRDLQPYCGCDGRTFRSSGSCPGARYRHRGECEGDPAAIP